MSDQGTIVDRITVRMYRKLLGDCFLITVAGRSGETQALTKSHIMIDCGVLQGTPDGGELMRAVVRDVYAHTEGKPLDLIVVTHEHHDHISGFGLARAVFEEQPKAADQVWFAWTEDPGDADAQEYQRAYGHALTALAALAEEAKVQTQAAEDPAAESLLGLAGFSGPLALDGNRKPLRGSRKIYQDLRDWAGTDGTRYLSPGQVTTTPGALGLATYVLGPPRDKEQLTNPLGKAGDTYFAAARTSREGAPSRQDMPFSPRHGWRTEEQIRKLVPSASESDADRKGSEWLHDRYFRTFSRCTDDGDKPADHKSKDDNHKCAGDFSLHEPQAYRMLDKIERSQFSNLALRMDNNTNNTSLVLAFDLPGNAGTMLFAADAQVGNWESWFKVEFRESPDAAPLKLKTEELLARTRFYKVGHHGSHNATLVRGLEAMSDDLVAMIPTDAEFAKKQSSAWQMPNPRVDEALQRKTRHRVLRGDIPAAATVDAVKEADPALAEAFAARIDDHDLWVEYCVYQRETGESA
jgi:hypothetical protein